MKILLLNPPFQRRVIRGNYSSSEPKADYLYPPADLVLLSGILDHEYSVEVIDSVAEQLDDKTTLIRISLVKPVVVIFVMSALTHKSDFAFMNLVKTQLPNMLLVGTGDLLLTSPYHYLKEQEWLDAIITDFTSQDILRYLKGDELSIKHVVDRTTDNQKSGKVKLKKHGDASNRRNMLCGIPRHDLFPTNHYKLSHGRKSPATLTMLSFGCPYTCKFCPMERIWYKYRSVSDGIEEMRRIAAWGIKEVFFLDQTFAARRADALEFCLQLASEKLNLKWACLCRVDLVDEELLIAMKAAGCHTIQFGVETANEITLQASKKPINHKTTKQAFSLCASYSIRTVGHFIFGLPGDDENSAKQTVKLAIELDCDFAAFNIAEAVVGTSMQEEAINAGWIEQEQLTPDPSQPYPFPQSSGVTFDEVDEWRRMAIRQFYFRPSYWLKRLRDVQSVHEAKRLFSNGLHIFKKHRIWVRKSRHPKIDLSK